MAGGAGRNGPGGIADCDERWRRIGWAADLCGKRSEKGGHVGDFLIVQGRGHALHDRVLPLAGTVVVELLVQDYGRQPGEVGKRVAGTDALRAVTTRAAGRERLAALHIA